MPANKLAALLTAWQAAKAAKLFVKLCQPTSWHSLTINVFNINSNSSVYTNIMLIQ